MRRALIEESQTGNLADSSGSDRAEHERSERPQPANKQSGWTAATSRSTGAGSDDVRSLQHKPAHEIRAARADATSDPARRHTGGHARSCSGGHLVALTEVACTALGAGLYGRVLSEGDVTAPHRLTQQFCGK